MKLNHKLKLNKETVRTLSGQEATQVAGAYSDRWGCYSQNWTACCREDADTLSTLHYC